MNQKGRDGYWNRSGRRSGGARTHPIWIPTGIVHLHTCPKCGNDAIPAFVTQFCEGCRALVQEIMRQAIGPDFECCGFTWSHSGETFACVQNKHEPHRHRTGDGEVYHEGSKP